MTAYSDLVAVIVMLTLVAGTPLAAAVIVLILMVRTRRRSRRPGDIASPSPAPATDVIDDFLQYPYGPWSYFQAGGLLMRAPRDEDGHVVLAQAHPARLDWCDDVTPIELLTILTSLEEAEQVACTRRSHASPSP